MPGCAQESNFDENSCSETTISNGSDMPVALVLFIVSFIFDSRWSKDLTATLFVSIATKSDVTFAGLLPKIHITLSIAIVINNRMILTRILGMKSVVPIICGHSYDGVPNITVYVVCGKHC